MLGPPKQFEPAQKLLGRETPNSAPRLQNARCGGPPFTARQMTGRSGWRCSGRHPACSESPKKPGCMRSSRKRWSYRASIGCDSPTCTGKLRNPLPSAAAGPFAGSAGCVTMCAAEDACWPDMLPQGLRGDKCGPGGMHSLRATSFSSVARPVDQTQSRDRCLEQYNVTKASVEAATLEYRKLTAMERGGSNNGTPFAIEVKGSGRNDALVARPGERFSFSLESMRGSLLRPIDRGSTFDGESTFDSKTYQISRFPPSFDAVNMPCSFNILQHVRAGFSPEEQGGSSSLRQVGMPSPAPMQHALDSPHAFALARCKGQLTPPAM